MNEFYRAEKLISELQKEVGLYQELYGSDNSREALKNSFEEPFAIFQRAMFFEIVCRISALFDPETTRKDKNLTLDHLASLCSDSLSKDLYLKVESVKYDFQKMGIKKLRNKMFAHNDVKAHMGKLRFTTDISYESVTTLLSALFSVVRLLGIESKMVDPDQIIVRDIKLPKGRDGASLVAYVQNT